MLDAVEYLKAKKRLCDSLDGIRCIGCPIREFIKPRYSECDDHFTDCDDSEKLYPEETVSIVEQWEKEHPVKTYKDVLLERLPDAKVFETGRPVTCRRILFKGKGCPSGILSCTACWNEEYRED